MKILKKKKEKRQDYSTDYNRCIDKCVRVWQKFKNHRSLRKSWVILTLGFSAVISNNRFILLKYNQIYKGSQYVAYFQNAHSSFQTGFKKSIFLKKKKNVEIIRITSIFNLPSVSCLTVYNLDRMEGVLI